MISRRFGARSVLSALALVLAAAWVSPVQAEPHKAKPTAGEAAGAKKAHGKQAAKAKKKKDKDKAKAKAKAAKPGEVAAKKPAGRDPYDQAAEELTADTADGANAEEADVSDEGVAKADKADKAADKKVARKADRAGKADKADKADKAEKADEASATNAEAGDESDDGEDADDAEHAATSKKATEKGSQSGAAHKASSRAGGTGADKKSKARGKTASLGAGNRGKAPKKTASREKTTKKAPKKGEANAPIKPCLGAPIDLDRNGREPQRLTLVDCRGNPLEAARRALSILSRPWGVPRPADKPGGASPAEIGPGIALLDRGLLTRIDALARRYPGRRISIISGYRPTSQGSLHQSGRALDLRIAGADNVDVVGNCRRLADSGCGYYPNSSFVHIDVRAPRSGVVHWIDASAPGEAPRYVSSWPPPPDGLPTAAPGTASPPANAPAPRPPRPPAASAAGAASAEGADDDLPAAEEPPASTDPPPTERAPSAAPEGDAASGGAGGGGNGGEGGGGSGDSARDAPDGGFGLGGRAPRRAGPPSLLPALDTAPRR
jgi:hypothetical protein